jgi:hypothetical protein
MASGLRQTYPGVPQLMVGKEYLLYLWTSSSSSITMPTGFSQGIFAVSGDSLGGQVISRAATAELMLDSAGHPVQDKPVSMRLSEMKSHVIVSLSRTAPAQGSVR